MKSIVLLCMTILLCSPAYAQNLKCVSGENVLILQAWSKEGRSKYIGEMSWSEGHGFYGADCEVQGSGPLTFLCAVEPEWGYEEVVAEVQLSENKSTAIIHEASKDLRSHRGYRIVRSLSLACEPTTETSR